MAFPVARSMVDRARTSQRLAVAFDHLGLATFADRLDLIREGGDLVVMPLPVGPGQLRAQRIKMLRYEDRDYAVFAHVVGGWLSFERPLPDVLIRTVRWRGGVVIDVGANTGFYALLAAECRRDVVVHAFEPFPPVVRALRRNLAANRSGRRVHVHAEAVTDNDGEMTLYVPPVSEFLETSASLNPTFKDDIATELKAATITLDRFWVDAGRPAVTVIKIDTEGTEERVLAGLAEVAAATRPVIFCEVLPRADIGTIDAFCHDQRYVRVRLRPVTAVVAASVEFDGEAWNHCFVPVEQYDDFVARVLGPFMVIVDERS